jgi:hypothetical protein
MSAALQNRIFLALAGFIATTNFLVSGSYFSNGNNLVGCGFGVSTIVWIVLAVIAGRRVNAANR